MKPPECDVCGDRLEEDGGGLVTFARTEADRRWDRRVEDEGLIGHPPYVEWFCVRHHAAAREQAQQGLTLGEARQSRNSSAPKKSAPNRKSSGLWDWLRGVIGGRTKKP